MFEATLIQKQAFKHATNGVSINKFNHSILFMIGAVATVWLFMVFVGTFKNKQKTTYAAMQEFSSALFIYILVGVVIYYC